MDDTEAHPIPEYPTTDWDLVWEIRDGEFKQRTEGCTEPTEKGVVAADGVDGTGHNLLGQGVTTTSTSG